MTPSQKPQQRISFRPVDDQDIFALRQIYQYYIQNSTATFHVQNISLEQMKQLVKPSDPKYHSLSIFRNDIICGYASYHPYHEREAFAQTAEVSIYLMPNCSGCGIGFQAMQTLEPLAKAAGIHTLLALVCHENLSSIRLFEKCGYWQNACLKAVGYKFGRYLDMLILQKLLS